MFLLNSAKDFLVESLENYKKGKLAFSILHAVTATELILKERLTRIHPNLIYKKIDSRIIQSERTVALQDLPQRLINFGVALNPKDVDVVSTVAKWRHEIVHHMPTYQPKQAKNNLGLLFDFIARFLETELNLEFKSFIPKSSYTTVNGLVSEWNKVIREAQRNAKQEGNILTSMECSVYGAIETICLRNEEALCHLCGTSFLVGECPICRAQAIGTDTDLEGEVYHWKCLNNMALDYMEMMREAQRNK